MKRNRRLYNIGVAQIDLVKRSRDFVNANDSGGNSVANPDLYLNSWARVRGNARLTILQRGIIGIPYYCVRWLADFRGYLIQGNLVSLTKRIAGQKYNKMVLTWGALTDFDDDGIYRDRYFGVSSRESQDTLWLVMYRSSETPRVFDGNVTLLYWPKLSLFRSVLKFFSTFGSYTKSFSYSGHICGEISTTFMGELSSHSAVKKVIVPYEGQPFQQTLFECIKKDFPDVIGVGYLHSAPPPLPTDLIYRKGCPSSLLVQGEGVKDMLYEHLNWPLTTLTVINSLRYTNLSSKTFSNEILLPYSFDNPDRILDAFNCVVKSSLLDNVSLWKVRNHPVQCDSMVHHGLERSLYQILRKASTTTSDSYSAVKRTVMIGATAAILEALEHGLEVIHIVSNPVFEVHSPLIWRHLDVERLGEYVFLYRIKKIGKYIKIGDSTTGFSTIFGHHVQS